MFGTALRLLAAGEAGQRLGGYVKNLATRYLVLSIAGIAFLGAVVFATLAGFWALSSSNHDPITSAGIMAAILALAGFLIGLIAYGTTRQKPRQASVSRAIRQPVQTLQSELPSVDDVTRQIEQAVKRHGPFRVATAAAAGGLIAGIVAKRLGETQVLPPRMDSFAQGRGRRRRREEEAWRQENGRRYA